MATIIEMNEKELAVLKEILEMAIDMEDDMLLDPLFLTDEEAVNLSCGDAEKIKEWYRTARNDIDRRLNKLNVLRTLAVKVATAS